jgi:hypothetical protein
MIAAPHLANYTWIEGIGGLAQIVGQDRQAFRGYRGGVSNSALDQRGDCIAADQGFIQGVKIERVAVWADFARGIGNSHCGTPLLDE